MAGFLLWTAFTLILAVHTIYQDSPSYFTSFYCNLGTMTIADSGNYSCISPKVIERGDKFGLSLVEFNKAYSKDVWFKAKVISTVGVNLTSVMVSLDFKTNYTMRYGYMVVVIGYQPINTWIDLVNIEPTADVIHNLSIAKNYSRSITYDYPFPSVTQRISYCSRSVEFISSFGGGVINRRSSFFITFEKTISAASIKIISFKLSAEANVSLETFIGGVLFFNSSQNSNTASDFNGFTFHGYLGYQFQLSRQINLKFGPSFNTKCLISYTRIDYTQDFQIQLENTTLNSYYAINISSPADWQVAGRVKITCIATIYPTSLGEFDYEDPVTHNYYPRGQCPAPTSASFSPTTKNWCQKCTQLQCLDCNVSKRAQCFQCNSTAFVQLTDGFCKCISGYGLNSSNKCVPCSTFYPNCASCNNSIKGCTQCLASFELTSSGKKCTCPRGSAVNSSGQCENCSSFYSNCKLCSSYNEGCSYCGRDYAITPSGQCVACSQLYQNCNECKSLNTSCTKCSTGFVLTTQGKCAALISIDPSLPDKPNSTLTIVLSVVGVTVLAIAVTCICFKRKCFRRNNEHDLDTLILPQMPPPSINPPIPLNTLELSDHRRNLKPRPKFGFQSNYASNNSSSESDEVCAICLGNQMNCRTSCGHLFHLICFTAWIKVRPNCPVCKRINFNDITITCEVCHMNAKIIKLHPNSSMPSTKPSKIYCKSCSNSSILNESGIAMAINK